MNIIGLKYLLAAAETGSFAAAARALNLHVSTLSRHIFALENELGVTVFEREHSGVRLTSSGQAVLIYVRQALADLDALAKVGRSGGRGQHGHINLGVRLPPLEENLRGLLSQWHHFHPDVELSLSELSDNKLCAAIRDRHLDVAIIPELALGPDIASEIILEERLFAVVPIHNPIARKTSITFGDLRRESILVQDWPHSHVTRSFYGSLLGHSSRFRPHPASKQSLFALVAAGFGVTLATESQTAMNFSGVACIPISDDTALVRIALAWMPQSEDPTVGRFIAFMRDEARSLSSR
jgi:DNA-binding transcriptional LysR family regulator